nr:deoxyuridine 5'-triphosphate nucleotidohydrolase, mitochondrial isoform X2 [Oryctolagus cuniculus]
MTALVRRPAARYRFLPSLLSAGFTDAWRARLRPERAGLSGPGPPLGPATQRRLLSSATRRSRGCSGAKAPAISPSKRARAAEEGTMRLRFSRLSEHATAPTRGSARAAGYDLYSAYDYTVPPMEKAIVKTDIQIALPSGCYGRIAGVIDEDYRGNVGVVLFNFGKEKFEVKKGDRIAQLICERIFYPEIEEVQVLDDTERGAGGFGSTGKN